MKALFSPEQLDRLQQAVRALGTPPGPALVETPVCGRCLGYHWLRLEAAIGDPQFGQIVRCTECWQTERWARMDRAARYAGIEPRQREKTFANFTSTVWNKAAIKTASAWAASPKAWLALHGAPGSGKTHLQLAIANALLSREQPFQWWYASDLVQQTRAMDLPNQQLVTLKLREEPILLLDELGGVRHTEANWGIREFLEPLLDYRYRTAKATCFTSIGSPSAMRLEFSESIGRRLEDQSICQVMDLGKKQWSGE